MVYYTPVQRVLRRLPLFSAGIQAGFPSPADDHLEGDLDLNELLISNGPATFFVRARGESMAGEKATIQNGDLLVVDRSRVPKNGDVVVACIDGSFTVKRLRCDDQGLHQGVPHRIAEAFERLYARTINLEISRGWWSNGRGHIGGVVLLLGDIGDAPDTIG